MKVQDLKIKFKHERQIIGESYANGKVYPIFEQGGFTHVTIDGPDFQINAHSKCVDTDMYWKDKGRKIALKRALEHSTLSKEDKASVWEEYRTMTKIPRW